MTEAVSQKSGGRSAGWLRKWLERGLFILAMLLGLGVLLLRFLAYEPFTIPSGSMYPTLMVGDYLFVSKYKYGYSRYSFPFGLVDFEGRIWPGPVSRGDVVVFRNPKDDQVDFIKRVVGLPGDRIQIRGGILHINGSAVERRRIEDYEMPRGQTVPQYLETLPNGVVHRILESGGDNWFSDDTVEVIVPEGHYFMLGDNRDNSADSRVIGSVPYENLIGRAEIIFLSIDSDPAPGDSYVRWERILDGIE